MADVQTFVISLLALLGVSSNQQPAARTSAPCPVTAGATPQPPSSAPAATPSRAKRTKSTRAKVTPAKATAAKVKRTKHARSQVRKATARPRKTPKQPGRMAPLPTAAQIKTMTARQCRTVLREHGVPFSTVPRKRAPGVAMPIKLAGGIGPLQLEGRRGAETMLDCRLAATLLAWTPTLKKAGVVSLEHVSLHRPGARIRRSGRRSAHAGALAFDLGGATFRDGVEVDVLKHWKFKKRGAEPCDRGRRGGEGPRLTRLRKAVCEAAEDGLFQVVLTPHYDRAHRDHLHLELKPEVDWTYVR